MVEGGHIVLLILNDGWDFIHGFVECSELTDGVAVVVVHFDMDIMLVFGLVLIVLFNDFLEATGLAKLNGHLAGTPIVRPFIR